MSFKEIAVQVHGLGKCYQIYNNPKDRLKQPLMERVNPILGRTKPQYYKEFWALKDVSFEVYKGETVGIIGQNGSGKSTLLQIICGILKLSTGSVETYGRVAALLELGAGFNPEFSGKENVFLNAAVLGLSQQQIKDCYQKIVDFADIGDFINQPVKLYSSGMYARLAFAVAINVQPDILIVDEALAVGDEPFQRKCFAHIEKIKKAGATILFVSHSGGTIINLCDRAILINKGERLFTGQPKQAVFYSQKIGNAAHNQLEAILTEIRTADTEASTSVEVPNSEQKTKVNPLELTATTPVTPQFELSEFFDPNLITKSCYTYDADGALIKNPSLLNIKMEKVNQIFSNQPYTLECDVVFDRDCYGVRFYALIRTTSGIDLGGCAHPAFTEPGLNISAGTQIKLRFPFTCLLNPATYFCNFAVQGENGSLHHRIVDAFAFRVMAKTTTQSTGIIDLGFKPEIAMQALLIDQD